MTCEECAEILLDASELATDDRSTLSVSAVALAHVEQCPACATKMREVAKLQIAFEQLRASSMHPEVPASVETNLLCAFRQKVTERHCVSRQAPAWRLAWACAATVMLIVTGIFLSPLTVHRDNPVKTETKKNGGELIGTRFSSAVASIQVLDENQRPDQNSVVKPKLRVAKGDKTAPEAAARRVPISPGDELSLNGGGSVVRVTLAFSSLVAMGVLAKPDISDSQVTADVWVDPFGAVVGVRLVPTSASAD